MLDASGFFALTGAFLVAQIELLFERIQNAPRREGVVGRMVISRARLIVFEHRRGESVLGVERVHSITTRCGRPADRLRQSPQPKLPRRACRRSVSAASETFRD